MLVAIDKLGVNAGLFRHLGKAHPQGVPAIRGWNLLRGPGFRVIRWTQFLSAAPSCPSAPAGPMRKRLPVQGPMRNGKAIEEIRGDSKSKDLLSRLQARSHYITLN